MQEKRTNDQDVSTQELTAELARLAEDELAEMVRTLQVDDPASLFGPTEFKMRELALKIAAKAYQQRLAQFICCLGDGHRVACVLFDLSDK